MIAVTCSIGLMMSSTVPRPEHTIRIAMLGSANDEDYDGAMAFKGHVEVATDERLKVELYPSGQFCSTERECLEGLQSGILQVFMFTTGGFGSVFGPAQVLDLPYAFEDDRIAECVLDGPLLQELGQVILDAELGIRLMTVSNTGGWRNFATTDRPIRSPKDIRNLKKSLRQILNFWKRLLSPLKMLLESPQVLLNWMT